ncbi:MAG: membrane protein insertase YidC [Moraxellaceae bacterium]|nr:membrane protein insertase YidC [Moraxellaceae bacterium]
MQMDARRMILVVVFTFSLIMLWENWTRHNQPKEPVTAGTSAQVTAVPTPSASAPVAPGASAPVASPTAPASTGYADLPKAVVRTDMLVAEVSALGGDISRLELLKHQATGDASKNFVLLDATGGHRYVANGGLIGDGLPNHKTIFELTPGEFALADGQDKLELRLKARAENGVEVTKVLSFHRGSYEIGVAYEVNNTSTVPLNTTTYFQLARDDKPAEQAGGFFTGVTTYTGPAFYTNETKFRKESFSDIEKGNTKFVKQANDGWVAMVQHYFVGAYLPQGDTPREFYARKIDNAYFGVGVMLPMTVVPGQQGRVEVPLYVGPQEQKKLANIAPGFDLVVDYGWLTVIAAPLFWLLEFIHRFVGNWGWAIIIVTILIKAAFFPLSAAGYKSMAKMKTLMPRMKQLQERYAGDRMKLNQEMMELYRKEKVNPMGGCLPILVQIPVFIALYWVLLGTVEMRQAPWIGWIRDLSQMDPYYVLPVLNGITMFIQTKLNPTPPDPIQAKVMLFMPLMFTVMFLWFPSGLVLYWVVNNLLSIAQQWYINRMIEAGSDAAKPAK